MLKNAILRRPGSDFHRGVTSAKLGAPEPLLTRLQYENYIAALRECGIQPILLEDDPSFPDGCFVEDTAIVTEIVAIITRPGHSSRQGEITRIAEALKAFRPLEFIQAPGTVDGGDIVRIQNHFLIGLSGRTNAEGARQLKGILERNGFSADTVNVAEGLHLKSGLSCIFGNILISASYMADVSHGLNFRGDIISLTPENDYAANCIEVNGTIIIAAGFPPIQNILEARGLRVIPLNMSEFRKMDGSLTCLSLLF